jgi:hypothetical protein
MTVAEIWEKGKYQALYGGHAEEAYMLIILIAVALGAFACGRLSVLDVGREPVNIENVFTEQRRASSSIPIDQNVPERSAGEGSALPMSPGAVVVSKNSTKYHLPWCSGARTIKEENKIWFASESEALAAGYTKAGNCR